MIDEIFFLDGVVNFILIMIVDKNMFIDVLCMFDYGDLIVEINVSIVLVYNVVVVKFYMYIVGGIYIVIFNCLNFISML